MSLGKAAKLPLGSESEERGIQIRTLREHEPNNALRLFEGPGCTPRGKSWRKNHYSSPAFKSRNSNPATATVTSESNGIAQPSCSVAEEKIRVMICNLASAASAAVGLDATRSTNMLCKQQENHMPTLCEGFLGNHIGSSISTGTDTFIPVTTAVAPAMTTSTTDDSIYDPEDLLLEPLLSSPRSDRERKVTSCGKSGPGNSNICGNSMLHEGRVMPQGIISSNHQVLESMSDRGEGEALPSSSGAMSSSTIYSSSLLSRPLVPVSPALSEVQRSSFIPGCDQSPRRSASGGGTSGAAGIGGAFAGDNETWYLNFPPNNQQHHRHQAHLYQVSTTAVASAARLAAEAANVAAAIQQATGPFSPGQPGSYPQDYSNDPSVGGLVGMRTQDANGRSVGRSSSGNGGNLLGGGSGGGGDSRMCSDDYNYPEESSRTSWSTTVPSSWQTLPKDVLGRPNGSGACQQRSRSLTEEECVHGSRQPCGDAVQNQRGDSELLAYFGNVVERSRTHGVQQMHGLSNDSPYARTSQYDLGGGNGSGSGSKRMKILGAADVSQGWILSQNASVGVGAINSHNASSSKGWRSGGIGIRPCGAPIAAEISPSVGISTAVPDSATPQKCSLGMTSVGTKVSAMAATSAARAACEASVPENNNNSDTYNANINNNGRVSAESGGGESSSDWVEREESEEESKAKPKGPGCSSSRSGGVNGPKAKVPFMLDPELWIVIERRAICTAKQCAYRSEDGRARRRHYHALCSHVHQNGERKGMRFQHHQLEKVQKHQRAHLTAKQNTQKASVGKGRSPTGSPTTPRSKKSSALHGMKEQSRAIKDANLEAHSPKDWTPELTQRLRDLVDELGPKWSAIAEKIPGKTATACMLHWRVGLNPNHMVKGSGTWTAEEDERLSKLVEVVGMKWSDLARHIPGRIAKQCRERYLNHLDPSLRKDIPWTEDEEALLMRLCFAKHNQWAEICRQLKGRSYNDVKNRFNLIQRRNKRAQGSHSPATSSTPSASTTSSPIAAPTGRRGVKNAPLSTRTASVSTETPSSSSSVSSGINGGRGIYHGLTTVAKSKADVSASIVKTSTSVLEAPVAVASCSAAATAVSSLLSTPVSFTPGAPGWCSVSSASCSYYSSTVGAVGTTPVDGLYGDHMMLVGHGCSAVTPPQNSTSTGAEGSGGVDDAETSSSFGLIGDELGEFGIDGPDSGIPGSGFAPGGYWHQMVKEESTMARESDDGGDMDDDDGRDNGDDENNDRPLESFQTHAL